MQANRLLAGATIGAFTLLAIALPTDLIPNPVFTRQVAAPGWAWPVAIASALLVAILIALPKPNSCRPPTRGGVLGGALTYLAVGCPTCNQIVMLAVGTTGALAWFAPLQPVLAALGIVVLAAAITHRAVLLRRAALPAVR